MEFVVNAACTYSQTSLKLIFYAQSSKIIYDGAVMTGLMPEVINLNLWGMNFLNVIHMSTFV